MLDTYKVHNAINEEVIKIEISKNNMDKVLLTNFEQKEMSKLSQFICYGRLKLEDCIIRASLPMKRCLYGGGVVQHLLIEYENLLTKAYLLQ